ncbi:N-formylglutamate amidohydrolase [Luteibaculum oceani]|uniref:N-formylglutamate amidohydrolase n=1 Tax=Luteibaculum oceani TaxID=1294296 RepID=A0A5C6VKG8_9FLAO|nr:N-formylglutamate amidohydrolase [Luteibaculum oceani]TXC85144.1 N-formylglutamate amidohydrolase [Luteibaculum oceani]
MNLIISCEHYSNELPHEFSNLFAQNEKVAETHRAYDIGAKLIFSGLQKLAFASFYYPYSRLLIEVNRSLHHPKLFSEFSKKLDKQTRKNLINSYYLPYRNKVEKACWGQIVEGKEFLHLSVHSFTPVLGNEIRNADIGLLYDPKNPIEREFAKKFKESIRAIDPNLKVRFNYPYLGTADGFTTYLRKKLGPKYAGIELEVKNDVINNQIIETLYKSLQKVIRE